MQNRIIVSSNIVPSNSVQWPGEAAAAVSGNPSVIRMPSQSLDWRTLTVGMLRSQLQAEDTHVTIWNGTQQQLAQQMDRYLLSSGDAVRIVLAMSADPVPPDLARALGPGLSLLARRPSDQDVLCLQRGVLSEVRDDLPLLHLLMREVMHQGVDAEVEMSPTPTWLCVDSAAAVAVDRLPTAGPGRAAVSASLLKAALAEAEGESIVAADRRTCLQAGMFLLWDLLEDSHSLSQSLEGKGVPRTADYWHGIMHRREPDAGNAAYWFRRVGHHPAFDSLAAKLMDWLKFQGAAQDELQLVTATLLPRGVWDPFAMIELTQRALQDSGGLHDRVVRRVQYFEMLNLLRDGLNGISLNRIR